MIFLPYSLWHGGCRSFLLKLSCKHFSFSFTQEQFIPKSVGLDFEETMPFLIPDLSTIELLFISRFSSRKQNVPVPHFVNELLAPLFFISRAIDKHSYLMYGKVDIYEAEFKTMQEYHMLSINNSTNTGK